MNTNSTKIGITTVLLWLNWLTVDAQEQIANGYWQIRYDNAGISQLINSTDSYQANVLSGKLDTDVRFWMNDGEWQSVFSYARSHQSDSNSVRYTDYQPGMPFSLEQIFTLNDKVLEWDIILENRMHYDVKIGDVAIDLPWNRPSGSGQANISKKFYQTSLYFWRWFFFDFYQTER